MCSSHDDEKSPPVNRPRCPLLTRHRKSRIFCLIHWSAGYIVYTVARDSRDPVVTTFHSLAGGMAANFNLQVFWVYSVANTWSACFNRSAFEPYSFIRKPGEGMCTFHLLQPIGRDSEFVSSSSFSSWADTGGRRPGQLMGCDFGGGFTHVPR